MATTVDVIRDRVASICAATPFQFVAAVSPFDFALQPSGQIDQVFRITCEGGEQVGGFNYSEERTDLMEIWVARKQLNQPTAAYSRLLADAASLRAAVIRDGATGGGDYTVPNGAGFDIEHGDGQEYAVLRLTIPVNYEATW